MMSFLPDLHEGHAPITLQLLFRDAIDAFHDWKLGEPEPSVMHEGTLVPISTVFDAMRECTDIMPKTATELVTERLTKPWDGQGSLDVMTFSTAARVMGVLIRKRRLQEGETPSVFVQAESCTASPLH